MPAKQQETSALTLALVGLLARPSAPQKPSWSPAKASTELGRGAPHAIPAAKPPRKTSLQNQPSLRSSLVVYERRRGKKTQEKIGGSQEGETALSLLSLTFTDAANAGEYKVFYSSKRADCLHRAGDVGKAEGPRMSPVLAALAYVVTLA